MADPLDPAARRVVDAAARKGVDLRITLLARTSHTAENAARALGLELGQIVKTVVFVTPSSDGGCEPILCLVAGTNRVDVARLAAVVGEPSIRRATAREARELTGFAIGGIPPIGHGRPVRAVMDPDLGRFRVVWAAAGLDRAVFPVPPATLRVLANAVVAPIAEERTADAGPAAAAAHADPGAAAAAHAGPPGDAALDGAGT